MIILEIEPSEVDVGIEVEAVITEGGGGRLPDYRGSYSAVPKTTSQVLETKNKSMNDNVTIESIPVSEIENPSGGWTFNIAYL